MLLPTIHLGAASLNQTPLDWPGNVRRIRLALDQARKQGVQVLVLPELCLTGYGCEDAFYSPHLLARAWRLLQELAPETKGLVTAIGLPLEFAGATYNVQAVCVDGQVVGLAPKQQLAGDGLHYEPRWFAAWPQGVISTFRTPEGASLPIGELLLDVGGLRIGYEICEDAWQGNRPGLRLYQQGVDLLLSPSASHFALGKSATRHQLVAESSRAFHCIYGYANLLGNEAGRVLYDGERLFAQEGRMLAAGSRLSLREVDLLTVLVDPNSHRTARRKVYGYRQQLQAEEQVVRIPFNWRKTHPAGQPWFSGTPTEEDSLAEVERNSLLPPEREIYRAVTLGLFDYLRKSRSQGFVLSLSGGADSAMCAVLAAHSLLRAQRELPEPQLRERLQLPADSPLPTLADWLCCVYQSTQNSSPDTLASAQALAEELGAEFHLWEVDELTSAYRLRAEQVLGRTLNWEQDDLALQNIQARVRVPGIWLLANLRNALLLTTSNRSELAVGYSTMDGDAAGGLAPISGLDKTSVRQWLKWAEKALDLPALAQVNALAPSAELRPRAQQQQDEADLMPYPLLNRIEELTVLHHQDPAEVLKVLQQEYPEHSREELTTAVQRFFRLWARNQWKRERQAPGFHLDDRNLDPRSWMRFPILSGGFQQELSDLDQ